MGKVASASLRLRPLGLRLGAPPPWPAKLPQTTVTAEPGPAASAQALVRAHRSPPKARHADSLRQTVHRARRNCNTAPPPIHPGGRPPPSRLRLSSITHTNASTSLLHASYTPRIYLLHASYSPRTRPLHSSARQTLWSVTSRIIS